MSRKSGNELTNERKELVNKLNALDNRIIKRAKELSEKYPNIIFVNNATPINDDVEEYLQMIICIEKHIKSLSPYQQGDLFNQKINLK
jgi:hypothetical protein